MPYGLRSRYLRRTRTGKYLRPSLYNRRPARSRRGLADTVRRVIDARSETKCTVINIDDSYPVTGDGYRTRILSSLGIVNGVEFWQRTGNQVYCKSATFRLRFYAPHPALGVQTTSNIRVLVVQPRQGLDYLPTDFDVPATSVDTGPDESRYIILYDSVRLLAANTNTGNLMTLYYNIKVPINRTWTFPVESQPMLYIYLSSGQTDQPITLKGTVTLMYKDM